MVGPLLFVGDPHGRNREVVEAVLARGGKPGLLVLTGDFFGRCAEGRLSDLYRPLTDAGWLVRYVHGNHDADSPEMWAASVGDAPGWNISGRFVEWGGLRIGGLGGVFRKRIWYPQEGHEPPLWQSRAAWMRAHRDRAPDGGLPMSQRATIFPEDLEALRAAGPIDILVCHEAPTPYARGFGAIADLAVDVGARLVVHGHHHRAMDYAISDEITARGLSEAEIWGCELESIPDFGRRGIRF